MNALAAVLLLAAAAAAEVREINSMREIESELTPGTLLVFDIDNTLLEPVGSIGSDQWYDYLVKAFRRDGLSEPESQTRAQAAWRHALGIVQVRPVEAITPALVRAQQQRGLKVMALTARGPEDAERTLRQLRSAGIELQGTSVHPAPLRVPQAEIESDQDAAFSGGVLLVGEGPNKGKALAGFLRKLGQRPQRVVFVDDKPHHARNVDAALGAAGIPCTAFRYGAADERVRAFNEIMGEASTPAAAELLFHGRTGLERQTERHPH